jgi:pimeloyl-ACP methyl ester carboxylesterase
MRSRIPGARKIVMAGAGHAINAEDPAGFEREVLDFLRGLP